MNKVLNLIGLNSESNNFILDKIDKINKELEKLYNTNLIKYLEQLGIKIKIKQEYELKLIQNGISQDEIDKLNTNYKYLEHYKNEKIFLWN
jgi:hypothetical protein